MHAIQSSKFITIGENFFPDKPIHNQIVKLYCSEFEGKVCDIFFF